MNQLQGYNSPIASSTFGPVTLDYEDAFGAFMRRIGDIRIPGDDLAFKLYFSKHMTFEQFVTVNRISLVDRDIDTYTVEKVALRG